MSRDLNYAAKHWDSVVMMSNKCPQQVAFLRHRNNQWDSVCNGPQETLSSTVENFIIYFF